MKVEKNKKEVSIRGELILCALCALWGVAGYKIGANHAYRKCIKAVDDATAKLVNEVSSENYQEETK